VTVILHVSFRNNEEEAPTFHICTSHLHLFTKLCGACPGPTRLSVLVAAPPAAEAPPDFVPKRNLTLNLRKCVYSTIAVGKPQQQGQASIAEEFSRLMHPQPSGGSTAAESAEGIGGPDSAAVNGGEDGSGVIWFQSRVALKGMAAGASGGGG